MNTQPNSTAGSSCPATTCSAIRLCEVCGDVAKKHVKGIKETHYVCQKHFKKFMDLKDKKRLH